MNKKITNNVLALQAECLQADGTYIIPEKYRNLLGLLEVLLKIAKIFTNDKIDDVIDKILESIDLLQEQNKKK